MLWSTPFFKKNRLLIIFLRNNAFADACACRDTIPVLQCVGGQSCGGSLSWPIARRLRPEHGAAYSRRRGSDAFPAPRVYPVPRRKHPLFSCRTSRCPIRQKQDTAPPCRGRSSDFPRNRPPRRCYGRCIQGRRIPAKNRCMPAAGPFAVFFCLPQQTRHAVGPRRSRHFPAAVKLPHDDGNFLQFPGIHAAVLLQFRSFSKKAKKKRRDRGSRLQYARRESAYFSLESRSSLMASMVPSPLSSMYTVLPSCASFLK